MAQENDNPVFILDSSWLVSYAQHRQRALSMLAWASQDVLAGGSPAEIDSVVPEWVDKECERMYLEGATDEYGIPKTATYFGAGMHYMEFPAGREDLRRSSTDIWRKFSRKAVPGARLPSAGNEVIANALALGQRGKKCYVFSYDSDITDSVAEISRTFANVHVAQDKWLSPEESVKYIIEMADAPSSAIVLLPTAAGMLYNVPETGKVSYYLLAAKMPFSDGNKREIGVSVHPIRAGLSVEDSGIKRYPVMLADVESDLNNAVAGREINMRRTEQKEGTMRKELEKMNKFSYSSIGVRRSKKHGFLSVVSQSKVMSVNSGRLRYTKDVRIPGWVVIDPPYISRFAPETGHALADFYGKHYEEMRTALTVGTRA